MKQIFKLLFSPQNHLAGQEGFIRTRYLFKLGMLAIIIIIFIIPILLKPAAISNYGRLTSSPSGRWCQVKSPKSWWRKANGSIKGKPWRSSGQGLSGAAGQLQGIAQCESGEAHLDEKRTEAQEVARAEQEVKLAAKALEYSTVEATGIPRCTRKRRSPTKIIWTL